MVVVSSAPRRGIVAVYILAWFLANGSTVIFNKYIFKTMLFRFPLTLTLIHMFLQSVLAVFTIDVAGLVERVHVERDDYYSKLLVISAVFCSNICLGNVALRFVPVSFMQTVKSLTPAATALLQYLIFGSRLTRTAMLSLIPVNLGVAVASLTELEFHLGGFFAAIVSCIFTGLKFVLSSQMLGGRYKLDSINLLYYMAPPSVLFLAPVAFYFESAGVTAWLTTPSRTTHDIFLLVLSGVVSFILNVTLFIVLKATSSVTVTVAGNVKTVLVIGASLVIFKNKVTLLNRACIQVFLHFPCNECNRPLPFESFVKY
jgi:solute carrier family 35, member E3